MTFIHLFAILGIIITGAGYLGIRAKQSPDSLSKHSILLLFLCAFLLRLFAAALSKGFGSDTACFAAWAERIFQLGPGEFYSPDVFTDYPPGYMYILWIAGAIRNLFQMEYYSAAHLILLKLPAILCDMALGYIIYREGSARLSQHQTFFLCMVYLFNPAIILNSSVWGQVDSVFTLCVVCTFLLMMRKKMFASYAVFAIGILIKPQTLLFSPVLLAGIIDHVFLKNFSAKKLFTNLLQGLTAIAGVVLLALPFGFENVWKQYFSTVTSYPYAAVNACNFWGMLGLNWSSQENTFLGLSYKTYGTLIIALAVIAVLCLSIRNKKDSEKYPFLGAFLVLTIFVFSVRMHERYMYPALVLLLLAYLYKPAKHTFLCFGGFATMHFYNVAWVLFFYDPYNYSAKTPALILPSVGMLLCIGLLYYITYCYYRGDKSKTLAPQKPLSIKLPTAQPKKKVEIHTSSEKGISFTKIDFLIIAVITLIYGCVALYDLGDMQAPSTTHDMVQNDTIELTFGESPATLSYYIAPWHNRVFRLEGIGVDGAEWTSYENVTLKNVFTWQSITLPTDVTSLRFTLTDTQASLLELVFTDAEGNILTPVNAADYPALFDEVSLYPEVSSFRNSMYFDEIYHGRTAYEFVNGLTSYENTHPPLGKIFIALGVAIFGMNPFGWRIAGAFFGILMVPFTYLFAKRLTKNTPIATLACILFTFDFMHFTQTRLATIDVYITFFVLLMYYFMYRYSNMNFYDTPLKKTFLPLGACGICMGLGVASKWTGVYAGVGLALIFFYTLFKRYREYCYAVKNPKGSSSNGISHKHIAESFVPNTVRTIGFCLIFFVVIPVCIYILSYIPFRDYSDRGLIERMLYNQNTMFGYHSDLNATHPYSSTWYQWPTIVRPIWYYSRIVTGAWGEGGIREGISSFGNPAVWWLGIPAALYMVYLLIKKKDKNAGFLLLGYMAQYLPWFFVTRVTFIYHYFPSVIFAVLMIAYSLSQFKERMKPKAFYTTLITYGIVVVVLFILFYPVLSGQPVDADFVTKYLRWFDSWVLTAS